MAKRQEILEFVNNLLNISEFDDLSINGLQVEGKEEIDNIILGVSISERLIQIAVQKKADMVIVHHGVFWKNAPTPYILTGIHRRRMALLLKNDINLAAYHLPLDAHSEIGNNAQIIKCLRIEPITSVDVGFLGELKEPVPIVNFVNFVNKELNTNSQLFPFGSPKVHRVLVISGSSSRFYQLALENNADTFIGGEIRENVVRELEEVGLNFINAGHYNTEKFGVQALGKKIEQTFKINCTFIDIPNPV